MLFFAFPAFAEDGDFVYSNGRLYLSSSDSSYGSVSCVVNVYSDCLVLASIDSDELNDGYSFNGLHLSIPDRTDREITFFLNYVGQSLSLSSDIDNYSSSQAQFSFRNPSNQIVFSSGTTINTNFPPVAPGTLDYETATGLADYLTNTGSVFSWLLTTMGSLITWIFGNAFLAVLFCLFVAGTVISFFVRVRQ